jgi:hypothetical protein
VKKKPFTDALGAALVAACPHYMWHSQVAIACGITWTELKDALVRGLTTDEEPFCTFAADYYAADMQMARDAFTRIKDGTKDDQYAVKAIIAWVDRRWAVGAEEASIMGLVEAKPTKRRALVESLRAAARNPSSELGQAIVEAGLAPATPAN